MSDVHECLAGPRCRDAVILTSGAGDVLRRDGAPTENDNELCPACLRHLMKAISQLPNDWAQLRAALGERHQRPGQKVRLTPEPAVPISTRKDALMRDIVDTARLAAELVADVINTAAPAGRRLPAPPAWLAAELVDDRSIAVRSFDDTRAHDADLLAACIRMVEPNIDKLAGHELHGHYAWNRNTGRHEIVDLIGVDLAFELVDLHHQARAELGLTRLRHRYEMPCPNCGAPVGRDDGTIIVDCKQCNSAWTEREYQFLAGLITHERLDMILKWLLAEAYWRLDMLQNLADMMHRHKNLDADAAAALEILDAALGEHKRPADRVVATDRKTAAERQAADDTWAFGNEPVYRRPKRKPAPARAPVENPIAAASLSTLVDIDADAVLNGDARCRDCNLIHTGECP